jgi:hypothetical protein
MIFGAWKRASYERFAYERILAAYGFDILRIGSWKLSAITDDIFTTMKQEENISETRYLELLSEKLKIDGYLL